MLYKLVTRYGDIVDLEPQPFWDLGALQKIEKDLESLVARNLDGVLFEDPILMPIFQERPIQPEGDIYALDRFGDLVIFELKVGVAGEDAVNQVIRYCQVAGRWTYEELDRRFRPYSQKHDGASLQHAHRETFELERPLDPWEFNRRQRMVVIGNASNHALVGAIDYWRRQGLSIEFVPYRIFRIGQEDYFEFISLPYDHHVNPADIKGVIFDTCRSWDYLPDGSGCLRNMLSNGRVSAYGDRKEAVGHLRTGDYVFFYHKGCGIVAAGKVKGRQVQKTTHEEMGDEWYWEVELLTKIPNDPGAPPAMSKDEVEGFLGRGFFWARIDKRPYLSHEESERLVAKLVDVLAATAART